MNELSTLYAVCQAVLLGGSFLYCEETHKVCVCVLLSWEESYGHRFPIYVSPPALGPSCPGWLPYPGCQLCELSSNHVD